MVSSSAGRLVPHLLDALHEDVVEVSDVGVGAAKGERVTVEAPQDGHQAHQEQALHHHADHVLAAHQATVKHR